MKTPDLDSRFSVSIEFSRQDFPDKKYPWIPVFELRPILRTVQIRVQRVLAAQSDFSKAIGTRLRVFSLSAVGLTKQTVQAAVWEALEKCLKDASGTISQTKQVAAEFLQKINIQVSEGSELETEAFQNNIPEEEV